MQDINKGTELESLFQILSALSERAKKGLIQVIPSGTLGIGDKVRYMVPKTTMRQGLEEGDILTITRGGTAHDHFYVMDPSGQESPMELPVENNPAFELAERVSDKPFQRPPIEGSPVKVGDRIRWNNPEHTCTDTYHFVHGDMATVNFVHPGQFGVVLDRECSHQWTRIGFDQFRNEKCFEIVHGAN